jgi:hypothetical protein
VLPTLTGLTAHRSEVSTPPRASVVLGVRGNTAALPGLVAALAGQDVAVGEVELVVVDNHARPQVSGVFVENTIARSGHSRTATRIEPGSQRRYPRCTRRLCLDH